MDLYLIRHAVARSRDAGRWPDDSKRPLLPEGEERFRRVASGLSGLYPPPARLLSSPFERAWRTAVLLSESAGWPEPASLHALEPDVSPEKTLRALGELLSGLDGPLALVGHRPNLHLLASYLMTGVAGGARIALKKGGALCLRISGETLPGEAELRWLLTPKSLLR